VTGDSRLTVTADEVREVYCVERTEWESRKQGKPTPYICPARYGGLESQSVDGELVVQKAVPSVWRKMAAWFLERGIRPAAYLRLQFDRLPLTNRAPEPLHLIAGPYEQLWHENHAKFGELAALSLKTQRTTARSELAFLERAGKTPDEAWAGVLSQVNNGLSALFRYCISRQLPGEEFEALAERYEPEAVLEFERFRDAYIEKWVGFVPPGFAARAALVYPMIIRRRMDQTR
jgi:hypothetical protein